MCQKKVAQISQVYTGLSDADKARVLFAAIGHSGSAQWDTDSCKTGVTLGNDSAGDPTWSKLKSSQRDVSFFKKENGKWCFYCKFSMNTHTADFQPTIRKLLDTDNICGGVDAAAAVKAKCSTVASSEEFCGAGKVHDATKKDVECAGKPCTAADASTCCKAAATQPDAAKPTPTTAKPAAKETTEAVQGAGGCPVASVGVLLAATWAGLAMVARP